MSYWSRFVGAFRSDRLIAEIDEELDAHVDAAIAAGRDPADARRALGSPLRYREESHDARVVVWLADLLQDLRFGVRMLLRSPGFSALAIMCLTLGGLAAFELTRLLGYLLYKVSPRAPWAFGAALAVVVIAGLVACALPAWRAARTDPIQALRG